MSFRFLPLSLAFYKEMPVTLTESIVFVKVHVIVMAHYSYLPCSVYKAAGADLADLSNSVRNGILYLEDPVDRVSEA